MSSSPNKVFSTILISTLGLILISAFAFCAYWTIANWDRLNDATQWRTQENVNAAYVDGYETALANKQDYINQIDGHRETISELQVTISELTILSATVPGLQTTISQLQATVVTLENVIADLETEVAILELQIATLTSLLENYENLEMCEVKFLLDLTTLYATDVVEQGDTVAVTAPTSTTKKQFLGWSIDGETIISLATYPITQNTIFYAVWALSHSVEFVVDGVVVQSGLIPSASYVSAPANPSKTDFVFVGWSVDGVTIVSPSGYQINDDTTFAAVFTKTMFEGEHIVYSGATSPFNISYDINPLCVVDITDKRVAITMRIVGDVDGRPIDISGTIDFRGRGSLFYFVEGESPYVVLNGANKLSLMYLSQVFEFIIYKIELV